MTRKSYWIASTRLPAFPRMESDVHVDVAVIGGGITGITAAYLLKEAGRTVALLERDRCCRADTGFTTAHLTCVTDMRLHDLVKSFGKDHARATWDAGAAAIHQMEEIIDRHQIRCDFKRVPAYLHAPLEGGDEDEISALQEDAGLAEGLGFAATYLDEVPLAGRPGVRFANQAKFHPLKYLAALVVEIPGDGSHVFERTEAGHFEEEPLSIEANGHKLTCDFVVVATHVPIVGSKNFLGATLFQTKLAPYSTYVIRAKLPRGRADEASYWDTADPYHYLRIDRQRDGDFAILGGEDHKTGQVDDTEECYRRLEATLKKMFASSQFHSRWSGQVVETTDGLPFIGAIKERQFLATGFAGNGMTFGTLAGMMARDAVLGHKNPWSELFDPSRKKVIGGTWDYLKENADYPYYLIKDRLAGAEGESLDDVAPGEGKILKVEGQRVAVYKTDDGNPVVLSPSCTHMGCLVHWNNAERTWDCPCHGSRFRATGEVIAGPAETPLEHVTLESEQKAETASAHR